MALEVHDLVFNKLIERWDEALPLGNGLLGALIWGSGKPLRISLDRADLWDLRSVSEWQDVNYSYNKMREWVKDDRINDLQHLYEEPYLKPTGPTRIPAGRIEISGDNIVESKLHLSKALAEVQFQKGGSMEIFISAVEPYGVMRFTGGNFSPSFLELIIPPYRPDRPGPFFLEYDNELQSAGPLSGLNYPDATNIRKDNFLGFIQPGWDLSGYSVCMGWDKTAPEEWIVVWSVETTKDLTKTDIWENALRRVTATLKDGWQKHLDSHVAWWEKFWQQSSLTLPNKTIETLWYREIYKFGSAARRGAPPISLQGVWTADQGTIPPWKGDYHHNLNTQLCYWPCYSSNHLEEGLSFLDWLWQTMPEAEKYTKDFFGLDGLNVPMTADLLGRQMGGWHQHSFSATISSWLAQHFYLHWRYSQDRQFLRERAYPYLSSVCTFLEKITEIGSDGLRFLPLSSSPEINDNRLDAWFNPTTNYDLALMRWAFEKAQELALELALGEEAAYWQRALSEFPDFSYKDDQLLVAPNKPLEYSHRHFSHLMAIHPLGLIDWEGGEITQQTILAALEELERLGSDKWCGYSFAWFANLAARARNGQKAEKALTIFSTAFCSPNTFHVNGDQSGKGYSSYTYRPFTLEGNFAAAAGIQEMLLQSQNGLILIFPAVPSNWSEIYFENFRAEGAFLVTARKEDALITQVRIVAEAESVLKLQNPFGNAAFTAIQIMPNGIKKNLEPDTLLNKSNLIKVPLVSGSTLLLKRK